MRARGIEGEGATVKFAVVGAGTLTLLLCQHAGDGVIQVERVGALCFAVRAAVVHWGKEEGIPGLISEAILCSRDDA